MFPLMRLLSRFRPEWPHLSWWDRRIAKRYRKAGKIFGLAASELPMGECEGFEKLFRTWAKAEAAFAVAGFRPLAIDEFIGFAAFDKPLPTDFPAKREPDEQPVFHSSRFKERYMTDGAPSLASVTHVERDIPIGEDVHADIATGTLRMPSTRDIASP